MNNISRYAPAIRGFTLIELLTVIAIIGILAAIIIPTVGAVRKTARAAQCTSNVRQIAVALRLYAGDNKDRLPAARDASGTDWTSAVRSYLPSTGTARHPIFHCPDVDYGPSVPKDKIAWTYTLAGGATGINGSNNDNDFNLPRKLSSITSPSRAPWVMDGGWNNSLAFPGAHNAALYDEVLTSLAEPEPQAVSSRLVFRHKSAANIAFADGGVRRFSRDQVTSAMPTKEIYLGRN